MNIAKTGAWQGEDAKNFHAFDFNLAKELTKLFKSNTVIDLGCGEAKYVKHFRKNGIKAIGFDGNPQTRVLSGGFAVVHDLTTQLDVHPADYVLCLEVGEHIPTEFTDTLIDNIHHHNTKGVVISWAIPNQGGDGHVNELPNESIKEIFAKLGYTNNVEIENKLRNAASLWWFKNTIMVFER